MNTLSFFFLGLIFCVSSAFSQDSKVSPVVLQNEKAGLTPTEFYITGVTDERSDKDKQDLLKGGDARAIALFTANNLKETRSFRPVVISIERLTLTESAINNGAVQGQIKLTFAFKLRRTFDTVQLVNYSGGVTYNRSPAQTDLIESSLRHLTLSALNWFNAWMDKQANNNPLLAKSVEVTFADFTEKPEGDTIYYSPKRPLTWADFKGKPNRSAYSAEVFTSFGYAEQVEVKNAVIHIKLLIKAYLPKSSAWSKYDMMDETTLNHEQRHFDITRIIAERFKQKIASEPLPVENYDGPINVDYLEALRQLYKMQTQYDKDTSHGINNAGQYDWNRRIDKDLNTNASLP